MTIPYYTIKEYYSDIFFCTSQSSNFACSVFTEYLSISFSVFLHLLYQTVCICLLYTSMPLHFSIELIPLPSRVSDCLSRNVIIIFFSFYIHFTLSTSSHWRTLLPLLAMSRKTYINFNLQTGFVTDVWQFFFSIFQPWNVSRAP